MQKEQDRKAAKGMMRFGYAMMFLFMLTVIGVMLFGFKVMDDRNNIMRDIEQTLSDTMKSLK